MFASSDMAADKKAVARAAGDQIMGEGREGGGQPRNVYIISEDRIWELYEITRPAGGWRGGGPLRYGREKHYWNY